MDSDTVPSLSTRAGHTLAKVLGIQLQEQEPIREDYPGGSGDTFVEEQPTTAEFLLELIPTGDGVLHYLISLFPFVSWIGRYNVQWLLEISWPVRTPRPATS